jgi:hypothetical protein
METNSYGNLIKLIKALAGVTTFTDAELTNISHLINRRYREAYNTSQSWPRYLANSEKRKVAAIKFSGGAGSGSDNTEINQNYQFIGLADGGDTGTGNTVSGSEVYQGLTNTNNVIFQTTYSGTDKRWYVGTDITVSENTDGTIAVTSFDTPGDQEFGSSDTDAPESIFDVETFNANATAGQTGTAKLEGPLNLIPYTETNQTNIGEFIKIHRKKAYVNQSQLEYDFFIDENGANFLNTASSTDNEAFVTFKKRLTPFSVSASWESSSVEVPIEFFYYIAHAVYADVLRLESKYDDAQKEEAFAAQYLSQELEKIDIIANNNNLKKKFSTHLNRNSR